MTQQLPGAFLTAGRVKAAHAAAEERAAGWHHVSLLHGDPEDPADARALERASQYARAILEWPGFGANNPRLVIRGGNDYTTWIFVGRNAALNRRAADRLATWIRSNARSWWRMRRDGTVPVFDDGPIA